MKNFVYEGERVTVTAPATTTSGQIVVVGGIVGVAVADAASGDPVTVCLEGVFDLAKKTSGGGVSFSAGDRVSWLSGECVAYGTSGSTYIGMVATAAASGAATARVLVNAAYATTAT